MTTRALVLELAWPLALLVIGFALGAFVTPSIEVAPWHCEGQR